MLRECWVSSAQSPSSFLFSHPSIRLELPAEMAEAYASGRQSGNHLSISPSDDYIPSTTVREGDLSYESKHSSFLFPTTAILTACLPQHSSTVIRHPRPEPIVPSATCATHSMHSSSSSILASSGCFPLILNTSSLSQSTTPPLPLA